MVECGVLQNAFVIVAVALDVKQSRFHKFGFSVQTQHPVKVVQEPATVGIQVVANAQAVQID